MYDSGAPRAPSTIAKKILVTHRCEKIGFYSHDVINRPYIRPYVRPSVRETSHCYKFAGAELIATFRLQYEDDYEYEFSVLSTRFRFGGPKLSKCACSELKTRTRSRPRTPI